MNINASYSKSMNDISQIKSPETDINNYSFYGYINEGSYCKVRVVQSKINNHKYALKYMPITQSLSNLKSMAQERDVLANLRYPFLCNLNIAFQDNGFMFMLLDLMPGGDLRYFLQHYTLSEKAIKILISEVSAAIEYVHSKSFVHRDVKPENILLDRMGHAHLCDFNIAASLTCESPLLHKPSGTFNYMAPEMHRGLPYGEQVDWWALGIVFYECMYGQLPYKGNYKEDMVSQMARGANYKSTEFKISKECLEAIQKFLKFQPSERIRDCYDVFNLPYFNGYSKEMLEEGYNTCKPGAFRIPEDHIFDASSKCKRSNILSHEAKHWPNRKCKRYNIRKNEQALSSATKIRNKIRVYGEKINDCVNMSVWPDESKVTLTSNHVFKTYIYTSTTTTFTDEEDKTTVCQLTKSSPSPTLVEPTSPIYTWNKQSDRKEREKEKWIRKPFNIRNIINSRAVNVN